MWYRLLAGALMVMVLGGIAMALDRDDPRYRGTYDIGDSVTVGVFGGLSKYYFWPSMWNSVESMAFEHGGLKYRQYALEKGGDWVWCHIALNDGISLTLGGGTTFGFLMPDSSLLKCDEIVFVDAPWEAAMLTTALQPVSLDGATRGIHRGQNGAFVAFLRFDDAVMGIDHGGDEHGAVDLTLPLAIDIVSTTLTQSE